MKGEGYSTKSNEDATVFLFESTGKKGVVPKVIVFFHLGKNIWNLGFGDGSTADFDDEIITNNQDVQRVLQTIANTVHQFLETHPDRQVYIRPVDDKRKRLYNAVISRKSIEIASSFAVLGLYKGAFEKYDAGKTYDGFLVSAKKH